MYVLRQDKEFVTNAVVVREGLLRNLQADCGKDRGNETQKRRHAHVPRPKETHNPQVTALALSPFSLTDVSSYNYLILWEKHTLALTRSSILSIYKDYRCIELVSDAVPKCDADMKLWH